MEDSNGGSISPVVVIAGVGIIVALLIGGAAFVRGGDADESRTSPTTEATPLRESAACDARADADALTIEAGLFDYDASESPSDLAEDVDAVLTGQLLSARSGSGELQASVAIKPGRMELGEGQPPNTFGLPVVDVGRVGQTASFVAFLRVNPAAPGGYEVAVDGLWLGCADEDLAIPVFDHPVGWAEVNSIDSIVSSVRDVRRVGQPLEPTVVGDGTTVSRVALVDGTQFALTLPESFGTDLVLGQGETEKVFAKVQGAEFDLSITVDFCPEDNLFSTARGLVATELLGRPPSEGVLFCRPDEFITMRLNPTPPFGFSPDEFDVVPISFGDEYQAFLVEHSLVVGQCCFEDRGPMWAGNAMFVSDGSLSTQVQSMDGESLLPNWTADLADHIGMPGEWVGDGAYLHGIHKNQTIVASTGYGFIVGLDFEKGDRRWVLDLEGHSPEEFSRTSGDALFSVEDWLLTTDIPSEGDPTAPRLWRFDGETGDLRWVGEGDPATDIQPDRPLVFGDVVIIVIEPSDEVNPTGEETARVLAFDIETGERRWSFDLETGVIDLDLFGTLMTAAMLDDSALLVRNADGVLFRIDPVDGEEIWRNDELAGNGAPFVVSNNEDEIGVYSAGEVMLLDPETGIVLRVVG